MDLPAQGLLGHVNFSAGKPDPRFQKQLNDAYAHFATLGTAEPWTALRDWLRAELEQLRAGGAAAFQDVRQASAVLGLVFDQLLPEYRRHHTDLLGHLDSRALFQPFFLVRAFEAVLAQGGPWEERDRIVRGALHQLNDFVGYRPIAILETRPRGEPYEHEKVRPIPLFLRGAGVAFGRYHDLVARALEILEATEASQLRESHFELAMLDELALDPRAYDQGHPVNRRPNYVFGEWDPHHIDNQGRYRRFVVRQLTLDALLERVEQPGQLNRDEVLTEAATVLAGTMLMASGVSGWGPAAHDSTSSLGTLMPVIARGREAFYAQRLEKLGGRHGARLHQEAQALRQPFGGARTHLNQFLARHRAAQLQQRHLSMIFAEMGYAEASRAEAARIPATSVRLLSDLLGRLAAGQAILEEVAAGQEKARLHEAARLLPEVEELLRRGIACGALVDPWNILGFQRLFPLSSAREDAIPDPRVDELLQVVAYQLSLYARLQSEAAALGEQQLVRSLQGEMRAFAEWWDRFATVEVGEVRRVHGGEAADSAKHVAEALGHWHTRGEAAANLSFWRQHLETFHSPKAFALVVDALLRKKDYRAAQALLVSWLGQAEQVPLEDAEHSFQAMALRWMLGWTGGDRPPGITEEAWPLVRRFFDHLEANAEEYWEVPTLELFRRDAEDEEEEEELFGAAYEGVTYQDSTGNDDEGMVADGGPPDEFDLELEAERLEKRLHFLSTLARLWMIAARHEASRPLDTEKREALTAWLVRARANHAQLLELLDAIHKHPIPEPTGEVESLIQYDTRRRLKEQLLHSALATCLDTALAVGGLLGVLGESGETPEPGSPDWEPAGIRLEQALWQGNVEGVRQTLPQFLQRFRQEPLVYQPLQAGGKPRQVLRARLAQAILRGLLVSLPRLGLLRETFHVLRSARAMEQAHPVPGPGGVSEFIVLFQAAFQGAVECVVDSAATWPRPSGEDEALVKQLEQLTTPFFTLWVEHSQAHRLSILETVRNEREWEGLRAFIRRYGADLFHARFMTLANLTGILHRGAASYLDYLIENPDPLHPVKLIEELGKQINRADAARLLELTLQAVADNYEEYKDYKTTTAQSDYGDNLHLLLDFLRLKASYQRHAWNFRPLMLVHDVLVRRKREGTAVLWQEAIGQVSRELSALLLEQLANLERASGLKLRTLTDLVEERFVRPLVVDRLCALIEPAMREARTEGARPAFNRLLTELRRQGDMPLGVGLDVPQWLRRLEQEVRRARASQTPTAVLAEQLFHLPTKKLTYEELRRQLEAWEQPL